MDRFAGGALQWALAVLMRQERKRMWGNAVVGFLST